MLEEHDGSPVVGEVLGKRASRAASSVADVTIGNVHGCVESISTDDLVQMGRRDLARLDEGVETLDADSRASESEGGLGRRGESQGQRKPLHLCCWRWDICDVVRAMSREVQTRVGVQVRLSPYICIPVVPPSTPMPQRLPTACHPA